MRQAIWTRGVAIAALWAGPARLTRCCGLFDAAVVGPGMGVDGRWSGDARCGMGDCWGFGDTTRRRRGEVENICDGTHEMWSMEPGIIVHVQHCKRTYSPRVLWLGLRHTEHGGVTGAPSTPDPNGAGHDGTEQALSAGLSRCTSGGASIHG